MGTNYVIWWPLKTPFMKNFVMQFPSIALVFAFNSFGQSLAEVNKCCMVALVEEILNLPGLILSWTLCIPNEFRVSTHPSEPEGYYITITGYKRELPPTEQVFCCHHHIHLKAS